MCLCCWSGISTHISLAISLSGLCSGWEAEISMIMNTKRNCFALHPRTHAHALACCCFRNSTEGCERVCVHPYTHSDTLPGDISFPFPSHRSSVLSQCIPRSPLLPMHGRLASAGAGARTRGEALRWSWGEERRAEQILWRGRS